MIPAKIKIRNYEVNPIVVLSILTLMFSMAVHCLLFKDIDEVQRDYFPVAEAIFNGQIPYHPYNGLAWEYPPIALLVIFIPRIFSVSPECYQIMFDVEMLVFSILEVWIVYKIADRYSDNVNFILAINGILMIMLSFSGSIFERFDIVPATICLMAIKVYLERKYKFSFVLLSIGALIKIYPALLVMAFIIPFVSKRDWKNVIKYTAFTLFIGIMLLIPFYMVSSNELFNFITYHSDRGLQIEATVASPINILGFLGIIDISVINSYGSTNISGQIPSVVSSFITPLMVLALSIMGCIQYLIFKEENSDNNLMLFAFLYVSVFVIMNKVFSAQYVVWLVPMFSIMMISNGYNDKTIISSGIMISITMMTMLIMAIPLIEMHLESLILVLFRNAVLVLLFAYVLAISEILPKVKKTLCANADELNDSRL